jgi:tyrosyl-tRNA synthetase
MKDIKEQLEVIKRGVVDFVSEEELVHKLKKGKPLRVKLGMDPTAPDIHLGHTVVMHKMRQFQDLGHKAVLIIGDYTAMVGDPSGTNKTRPMLTKEEIVRNAKTYFNQASKILDVSRERLEIRYNSEWLDKMKFADVIKLASMMTVARMLERDTFEVRYKAGQPIGTHEFLYPLMQGYDSVMIDADVELGGTDQTFNNLVGRDIQRAYDKPQQIVITMPLLVGLDGVEKMSKSKGNYIGVTDAPEEMFGKVMSISDELMWNYYELLSSMDMSEVKKLKGDVESGKVHPKKAKENLAKEIVARYHDDDAAKRAKEHFDTVIVNKGKPEDIEEFKENAAVFPLVDAMVKFGSIKSKGEAKRLISQNAVAVNDEKITDVFYNLPKGKHHIKVGKRNHFIVTIYS